LDQNHKVLRTAFIISLLVLSGVIFFSCTKESQFIQAVELSDNLYIVETDTVTPVFSVYRLDSFQTSGSGSSYVGEVNDPYFGNINSESYARFGIAINYYETVGLPTESYDSIVLVMHGDHRYYGDTSSLYSIGVKQLKQDVDGAATTYYNHNSLFTSTEILGSTTTTYRPNIDDSVRIKLSDDFGAGIFNLYKNKDYRITNETEFLQYFRGLNIYPGDGNKVIYSFGASDSTMYIRLYYHDDQGTLISKYLDFQSKGGSYQFNHINYDPAGTELETLQAGKEMNSSALGHRIFINDLAGIGTKITFPTIPQLALINNFVRIGSAAFYVSPVPGSFDYFPLIDFVSLGISNEESSVVTTLYSLDGTYQQTGNLNVDLLNGSNTFYLYDLTALMRSEIVSTVYTSNIVYLQSNTGSGTGTVSLNRLVAADATNPIMPSRLACQLLFYKN
jgi:hypothetical protein